ncbi:hypothetical protein FD15_GL000356 [Liquorilactobacillus sucicola DSM 21376 = JCM 15457]|uniref:Uncharacterized protein n=1 Tax=Liquorilactobacillus sucicola DSM 21376 = JCM 15457 TaxID=1423806 RepID=A0A0R2DS52_9LACO|nr:hypothetical protein FD15_GL000356 [Liquorilactobacillus sucicola DSM 21376 = JCM 15457]
MQVLLKKLHELRFIFACNYSYNNVFIKNNDCFDAKSFKNNQIYLIIWLKMNFFAFL